MKKIESTRMKPRLKPHQFTNSEPQNETTDLMFKEVKTSIGIMMFGSTEHGLCLLDFKYRRSFPKITNRINNLYGDNTYGTTDIIELAERELKSYLEGKLKSFTTPLDIRGSEFQLKVWKALLAVKVL